MRTFPEPTGGISVIDTRSSVHTASQPQPQLPSLQLVAGPRLRIGGQLLQLLIPNSAQARADALVAGATVQTGWPAAQHGMLEAVQSAVQAVRPRDAIHAASQRGTIHTARTSAHSAVAQRAADIRSPGCCNLSAAAAAMMTAENKSCDSQQACTAVLPPSGSTSPHSISTPTGIAETWSTRQLISSDSVTALGSSATSTAIDAISPASSAFLQAAAARTAATAAGTTSNIAGGGTSPGMLSLLLQPSSTTSAATASEQLQQLQLQRHLLAQQQAVLLETMQSPVARTPLQQQQQLDSSITSSSPGFATGFSGLQSSIHQQQQRHEAQLSQMQQVSSCTFSSNPLTASCCQPQPGSVSPIPVLQLQQLELPIRQPGWLHKPQPVLAPGGTHPPAAAALKPAQPTVRLSDVFSPELCSSAKHALEQQLSSAYASGFTDGGEAFKRQRRQPNKTAAGFSRKQTQQGTLRKREAPSGHQPPAVTDKRAKTSHASSTSQQERPSIVEALTAGAAAVSAAVFALDENTAAAQLQQMTDEELVRLAAAVASAPLGKLCGVEALEAAQLCSNSAATPLIASVQPTDKRLTVPPAAAAAGLDAAASETATATAHKQASVSDSAAKPPTAAGRRLSDILLPTELPAQAWQQHQQQQQQWMPSPDCASLLLLDDPPMTCSASEHSMMTELAAWLEV